MFVEHTLSYDAMKYDFQDIVKRIFDIKDLQRAHELRPRSNDQITFEEDTKTWFHRHYYDSPLYGEMIGIYETFVKDIILPRYSDSAYVVQVDPSFRIGIPNNTALGIRNDDTNDRIGCHCDADYNHQPGEINFIVPITPMFDTNSVYVESEPGKEDFHPVNLSVGDVFCFYGNKCRHYNVTNTTGLSRLSIDFRIIPMSRYIDDWASASVHGKRPLTLGGYFKRINGDSRCE
jgi:hypothetical protein